MEFRRGPELVEFDSVRFRLVGIPRAVSMPKKETRTIEVDGVRYRYRGDAWRMERDDCGEVLIELANRGREKVRATFT